MTILLTYRSTSYDNSIMEEDGTLAMTMSGGWANATSSKDEEPIQSDELYTHGSFGKGAWSLSSG